MKVVRGLAGGLMGMCVWLAGCGGGGGGGGEAAPTALPTSVALSTGTAAEVGTATTFATNLTGPTTGLKFAWDFGDGSTSTEAAPAHAYATGGSYEVSLTVTNEAGTTRTTTMTVLASRMGVVQGSVCSGAQNSGWCWQRPTPAGGLIADVFFLDGSTGWAVGDAGLILKTTDGGATWVGQASGVSTRLTQVRFSDASHGWAVGMQATILRTTDGGATWVVQAPGVATNYYGGTSSLMIVGSQEAIATFDGNTTRTTVDGGEHWVVSSIVPRLVTPNGTMWSLDSSGLVKSNDLGQHVTTSLSALYPLSVQTVNFADDLHGWATGTDYSNYPSQLLWHTADGGATWQQVTPNGLPPYFSGSVTVNADGSAWLNTGSQLYRTEDGGASFTPVSFPSDNSVYYSGSAQVIGPDSVTVTALSGGVYLTRDRGQTWTLLKVNEEQNYYSPRVQITGGTLWLHYPERSYRSVDNGSHWQRVFGTDSADNGGSILAAWFFDANKGIGYSPAGWVVETSDSGKTWTRKTLTPNNFYGATAHMQFASATTGWLSVGSYNGAISKTIDGGTSWWTPLATPDFGNLSDFHFIDDQHGWAVGVSGAISVSTDGAQTWTRQTTLPYNLRGIRFADANVGLVVGDGGIIARTADSGATWTLRASRVNDSLTRVTFVDAHTAWAVGANGAVTQSVDGGSTWTRVRVASTANFNDVFFLDAQHGWIVGSGGTVLATSDAGRSWQVQSSGTDKNLNTAFFIDPRTGWIMGDGGSVLVTATGGN